MGLEPRGIVNRERLAWAAERTGPSWLSCAWWVLSLCPFNCAGREGCRGMDGPLGFALDDEEL